ncbi:hypothetical protein DL764_008273 [Monosporascus ibericus]|uniref:Major facilitator superfamily (MFS) profile domain-containing protein n=1 Tax=Monosporascus ibericus TaxID=155417 RepID=A0A4Q4T1A0_9PEZI|nr:hypothetical protein DL764_008273 [Monosporascus ibericus]
MSHQGREPETGVAGHPQAYQACSGGASDGGTTAWLVVLGAWCVAFCSVGWLNRTIYDKYGPRQLVLGGTFLHVFGLMMASISDQYYQLLLSQGVCSAIGVAAMFQPMLTCIPGWFEARRGVAYGILATGSSIGGIVFPIMVSRLVNVIGYGWTMRASAFLILGLLIIANLTVRARNPPRPTPVTPKQLARAFREVPFIGLILGMCFLTFGNYIPINYIQAQAVEAGMRSELVGYIVTILNAGSLFGRIISGIAGDKVGHFNTFIFSCFCSGVVTLGLWIPGTSNSALITYTMLFGFFSGAYVSLIGALVAQISPPHEMGFRTGIVFLLGSVPGLVTNPIAGAIVDSTGDYVGLKIFAGVMLIVGSACVVVSRVSGAGWKLSALY